MAETTAPVTHESVEKLIRDQLSKALGGRRGILEGALPTLAFTLSWITAKNLRLSLGLALGIALALLVLRLVQRSPSRFVFNAFVGIGIAAVFALRSGKAEDAFLPSIYYNAGYFVIMAFTALIRWPLVGFMIGSVTGDPTEWRRNPQIVRLCTVLTWMLAAPCALRVAVYYPLWRAGEAGALGIAKIALGWPLQVAVLSAMVWLLSRNHTPLEPVPEGPENALDSDALEPGVDTAEHR